MTQVGIRGPDQTCNGRSTCILEELDKGGRGCFVMGDFRITGEIHKMTHVYPFMPEKA